MHRLHAPIRSWLCRGKRLTVVQTLLISSLLIGGCGQKGPLVAPVPPTPTTAPVATAPVAASSSHTSYTSSLPQR